MDYLNKMLLFNFKALFYRQLWERDHLNEKWLKFSLSIRLALDAQV